MTDAAIHVRVFVRASPQGSKKAFNHRSTGRAMMMESSSEALKMYRAAIGFEARRQMKGRDLISTPVGVSAVFTFKRPKSHSTTKGLRPDAPQCCYPAKRGDVDKLLRSTLDALSGTVYRDDAQVVTVSGTVRWGDADETSVFVSPVDDVVDLWTAGVAA